MKSYTEPVNLTDLWTMLGYAVRYAMGRRSYATGEMGALVRAYAPKLAPQHIRQIRDDIATELAAADRMNRTLGDPSDDAEWRSLVRFLDQMLGAP
jgi:hypothetical protein